MKKVQTNWYKHAVIYQIYPRSFKDSNDDGLGDIPGIISKLDYLKDLGINCVWLSPVYSSPQEDNGYDISDYRDIYPPFGTNEDLKTLIKEMHKRGIRLIMDLVANHTSSEHKWFKEAIKDKNSPYRDYYIIKEGRKNGELPPNNWTGFFGEKAWERIPGSNDYYLHLFAKGQPDLNWENPKVREEIKDILKYYFDLGVDGFRCDVINLISKKQDFKNRAPSIALVGRDAYINGPRLHEFLHELNQDVISKYDVMTVGETVMTSLEDAKLLVDEKREELTMIFNFENTDVDNYFHIKYMERKFSLPRLKKVYAKWQNGLSEVGWNSLFIENHDQRRSAGRFGTTLEEPYREKSSKMLATSYMLMKGTPFIYQGQELGMTNYPFKDISETRDVEIRNIDNLCKTNPFIKLLIGKTLFNQTRDNARTPMQWDKSEFAGFSNVTPWINVNPNKEYINAEDEAKRADSLYVYYQKLIRFRIDNDIIPNGKYIDLLPRHKDVLAYKMKDGDKEVVVISNFSKKTIKLELLEEFKDYKLMLVNEETLLEKELTPYETRVYQKA